MYAFLTILAVSGWPTTHVQVEATEPVAGAEADGLSARLADRLLDAGWTLAPLDREADARVFVTVEGDLARVSVEHGSQKQVSFVRQPLGEVLSLDVVHQVVEALEAGPALAASTGPIGTRVGLVFDRDTTGRGEAALLFRNDGFWVVPEQAPASWRICVRSEHEGYWIVRSRSLDCSPPWADELRVEPGGLAAAVHRQADGIRFGTAPVDTDLQREVAEANTATALLRTVDPAPRPNPRTLRMSAEGGLAGLRVLDPLVGVRLDVGRRRGVVGSLRTSFLPSFGNEFRAVDTFLTAGPKLRGTFAPNFDAWVGVTGGLMVHLFDHDAEPVVTRVDPAVVFPLGLSVTAHNGAGFSLALDQSFSVRNRRYTRRDEVIWERSAYRIGVVMAFHYERVVE